MTDEKHKKQKRKKSKISFDEEVVSKDQAADFIDTSFNSSDHAKVEQQTKAPKSKKRKQKDKSLVDNQSSIINENINKNQEPKKLKRKRNADKIETTNVETQEELNPKKPEINTKESIRAKKRRKHQELLANKKFKGEVEMQQKCLNYVSMWKHSRDSWKFEKLKQIWLQHNIFDTSKVPEEFYQTVLDYFNSGKGKVKQELHEAAVKIINEEEGKECQSEDNETVNSKYERARSLVQNLQE